MENNVQQDIGISDFKCVAWFLMNYLLIIKICVTVFAYN